MMSCAPVARVLVLQNLGVAVIPRWHYAVVVGIDTDRDRVILRSGEERRHEVRIRTFLRTWRRSDYWAMVVLQPGTLPTNVDRQRHASAVAALESAGQRQAAQIAWRAALSRWPNDSIAMFGLAGVLASDGNHADAVMMYRQILEQGSMRIVARNNLALSLAELGQFDDAGREIARAIRDNEDAGLEAELLDTQATLQNMQSMTKTTKGE